MCRALQQKILVAASEMRLSVNLAAKMRQNASLDSVATGFGKALIYSCDLRLIR